jgi:hypothetical protein
MSTLTDQPIWRSYDRLHDLWVPGEPFLRSVRLAPKEHGMPCDGPLALQCIPNGGSNE